MAPWYISLRPFWDRESEAKLASLIIINHKSLWLNNTHYITLSFCFSCLRESWNLGNNIYIEFSHIPLVSSENSHTASPVTQASSFPSTNSHRNPHNPLSYQLIPRTSKSLSCFLHVCVCVNFTQRKSLQRWKIHYDYSNEIISSIEDAVWWKCWWTHVTLNCSDIIFFLSYLFRKIISHLIHRISDGDIHEVSVAVCNHSNV